MQAHYTWLPSHTLLNFPRQGARQGGQPLVEQLQAGIRAVEDLGFTITNKFIKPVHKQQSSRDNSGKHPRSCRLVPIRNTQIVCLCSSKYRHL